MYRLNGHCARKSAVLVLVWCYIPTGDREQDLWSYWLPVGCIKQLYDKQTYRWWLHARSVGWGEQWSTDIAVSWNLVKPSDIQGENTSFKMLLFTPLTWISIDVADSYLHPLLLLRSLVHCVRLSIIHILGFITPYFLHIFVMIMLALAIFQAWI